MVSSTSSFKALASIFSIIAVSNAHMIMKTPIPYGRGTINSSPLNADGSDYPCKGLFDMTDPTNDVNHLVPGVPATLSFTGSAVHGGGSCQVALTTDLKPTKNSKWMVIKSIEGGCPANVAGNLPADPNGSGASTFQYTVPKGFPEGDYTISWTWYNKIGNREMYMNCGRAKIGNSKKRYALPEPKIEHRAADYPDIFKANLNIFSCTLPEGNSYIFPNGGGDVQVIGNPVPAPCGGGGSNNSPPAGGSGSSSSAAAGNGGGASSTQAGASTTRNAGGAGGAATTSASGGRPTGFAGGNGSGASSSAAAGTRTSRPGVFVPSASSSAPAATDAPADPTSATVQPIPQPTGSSGSGNGSGSGSGNGSSSPVTGSNAAGSPCSQEGAWSCSSDGKSFQRCASGIWSAPMAVAAGTSCTPGTSMDLSMKVVGRKRDMIAHLHHRRSGHHIA